MKKQNRVYGIIGIRSRMSNWNADFSGRPKHTSKNEIYGSDKALKYPMKYMWEQENEKILYIKSFKIEKGKLQPNTLKERYEMIFEEELGKDKSARVLGNIFKALDVMNFGATFAEGGQSFSVTGAVQIGQGFNLYEDTNVEVQDILSPFRNSAKEEADATSLGTKIMTDRVHYCYPFAVNPMAYDNYVGIADEFDGYTDEAYEKFKTAALVSATAFATNSKIGSENEYALFVEMNENDFTALPDFAKFVKFELEDDKSILDFSLLNELLSSKIDQNIKEIELYINPYHVVVENFNHPKLKIKNIYTREVI